MNTFKSLKDALIALNQAEEYAPRGLSTKELLFVSFKVNDNEVYMNYPSRKLNVKYIKEECKWYLRADKYDTSIAEHAKMWTNLINKDNSISSNYGAILFNDNFITCANTLLKDHDSRRALIYIGDNDNLQSESQDKRCTNYIQFFIRQNKLHMIVSMRSNDAIFGCANDLPFFNLVHNLMYNYLKHTQLNYLNKGDYIHCANSFHCYKRHYKKLNKMINEEIDTSIIPPSINSLDEVLFLTDKLKNIEMAKNWSFSSWLYDC
jgi:thymidylate synthase